MREPIVVVWGFLFMITVFFMSWIMRKRKRQAGKYVVYYKLFATLITFIVSWITFRIFYESHHLPWVSRFVVLLLASVNLWVMYKRPWTIQHNANYEEDSFLPEFAFVLSLGLLLSVTFVMAPKFYLHWLFFDIDQIVPFSFRLSSLLWDLPLIFLIPFLGLKLVNFVGQVPFRMVEKAYIFPIETFDPQSLPWRDLMQVNFRIKKSLLDEYDMFSWAHKQWIEAPREASLGDVYKMLIQDGRQRQDVSNIQDLGDHYGGTPQFWWMFHVAVQWYRPSTWFRKPRYLNPILSIKNLKIQKHDIIVAKRIPGDGSHSFGMNYDGLPEDDPHKTVIIRR